MWDGENGLRRIAHIAIVVVAFLSSWLLIIILAIQRKAHALDVAARHLIF